MDIQTLEIAAVGLLNKTATFIIALISIYAMQVLYDRTNSVKYKEAFDLVEKDGRAVADYFGWRILAFAVLAGFIYG